VQPLISGEIMEQDIYLIIGASGISGQAAIQAVRNKRPSTIVVGTTSSDENIPNCDQTIRNINFKDPESVQKIVQALPDKPRIKMMAFIPAKGRVAMPALKATVQQIKDSVTFSIVPMLNLISVLKPEITVCHSAFIQMPFLLQCYGAMTFTKYLMDDLAIKHQDKLKVIRFGIFESNALKGIQLLLERAIAAGLYDENSAFITEWKKSGLRIDQWLEQYGTRCEIEAYQKQFNTPYRRTEAQDITKAYERVLDGETAPIINVIGNWLWTDNKPLTLPPEIQKMADDLMKSSAFSSFDDYLHNVRSSSSE